MIIFVLNESFCANTVLVQSFIARIEEGGEGNAVFV